MTGENDEIEEDSDITVDASLAVIDGMDMQTLMVGFQKMESEVIKLRDNLVGIVDESLNQIKDTIDTRKVEKRMDHLEKLVLDNKSELNNLHTKIDEIINHQQKVKPIDSDALDKFIADSQTTFSKLENITSIHTDSGRVPEAAQNGQHEEKLMQEVLAESKKIHTKLEEVNRVTVDIKDNIVKQDETKQSEQLKEVVKTAEKVMPVLDKISKNVSSLVEQFGTSSKAEQPSVRPKQKKKPDNQTTESASAVPENKEKPEVEIIEPQKRKGIFFSSSIGLQCDIQALSNNLNSRLCTVKTFHIEKHTNAKDPELFLRKNLDILDENDDVDFIILSVGTNDITKLDLGEDIGIINDAACDHSKNLAHIANETSQKYDIDVFIVERPARFDNKDQDPENVRSVLTISANGIFPSLITPMKKVHFIPLPSLSPVTTSRDCFVKDGVHLSAKGKTLFCLDMEAGVKSVFSDLKDGERLFHKVGRKNDQREDTTNQRSRGHHGNFQPFRENRN